MVPVVRALSLAALGAAWLTVGTAFAAPETVALPRLRVTLAPSGERAAARSPLAALFELLRLRAVGVIVPRPGTTFRVTAVSYSSTVSQTDLTPCLTAAGTRVRPGIVATNFLPLGTRLRIGESTYVVEDRMNERYNGVYIIDVWQPTTEQARAFGAQLVEVEILGYAASSPPTPAPRPAVPPPVALDAPPPAVLAPVPPELPPLTVRARLRTLGFRLRDLLSLRAAIPEETDCLLGK